MPRSRAVRINILYGAEKFGSQENAVLSGGGGFRPPTVMGGGGETLSRLIRIRQMEPRRCGHRENTLATHSLLFLQPTSVRFARDINK